MSLYDRIAHQLDEDEHKLKIVVIDGGIRTPDT